MRALNKQKVRLAWTITFAMFEKEMVISETCQAYSYIKLEATKVLVEPFGISKSHSDRFATIYSSLFIYLYYSLTSLQCSCFSADNFHQGNKTRFFFLYQRYLHFTKNTSLFIICPSLNLHHVLKPYKFYFKT